MSDVLVITPTTGSPDLIDAIKSVQNQSYPGVRHLIVVDGADYSIRTDQTLLKGGILTGNRLQRVDLPFNTGAHGFYGHRIMAAFSHLVNHDYLLFLDQDNWFEPDHIKSLVMQIEDNKLDWAYSLRKIYDKEKNYLCDDNCESLGRWPVWVNDKSYLIDSSSYCFKTTFFRQVGHIWDHGWGADRRFYMILKEHIKHDNYGCNHMHTLCYRLGGNEGSVQKEFFIEGNEKTKLKYGEYPWLNQSS